MTTGKWLKLFSVVDNGVRRGSPGHDFGHSRRDALGAFALATDKKVTEYLPAEIVAGMIAGMLHDYGVAFVARYKDTEWLAGHAESGAWRVYELLKGIIEENLLLLACYSIAAHTHYLKPVTCEDGSVREPWYYELFEADGRKYGWAVLACRFADRLDTNGVTLMLRHFLANADAAETKGCKDLSGTAFYEINRASIQIMVTPKNAMMDVAEGKQAPTTLRHIDNFANSNFGNTPYSKDDYLFPTMQRLMGYKVAQVMNINVAAKPVSKWEQFRIEYGLSDPIKDMKKLLFRVSRSPRFEDAWAVLDQAFGNLSIEEIYVWANIFAYANTSYDTLLQVLKNTIVESGSEYATPVIPLIDGIIAEIS